jgi:Na+-driven multidrug efflux pump
VLWLSIHALWIATVISVCFEVVFVGFPVQVGKIWDDEESFIYWIKEIVPKIFYTSVTAGFQYMCPVILQAMQKVVASTVLSFVTLLLPFPVFSTILYFTDKKNPARLFWCYPMNDVFSVIVDSLFLIAPFRTMWNAVRDDKMNEHAVLEEGSREMSGEEFIKTSSPTSSSENAAEGEMAEL